MASMASPRGQIENSTLSLPFKFYIVIAVRVSRVMVTYRQGIRRSHGGGETAWRGSTTSRWP